ncbi:hypothetical protein DSO57_1020046 [Entomophthora muscae]|uniref:Uncharacterized protein n=1 Tax=Entomophthora muscae TaxID=34485 RepID=A0ACC2S6B9_9FUNG|nr:hypothetical protein DSO57_1020046 [Entomophthora muscae]
MEYTSALIVIGVIALCVNTGFLQVLQRVPGSFGDLFSLAGVTIISSIAGLTLSLFHIFRPSTLPIGAECAVLWPCIFLPFFSRIVLGIVMADSCLSPRNNTLARIVFAFCSLSVLGVLLFNSFHGGFRMDPTHIVCQPTLFKNTMITVDSLCFTLATNFGRLRLYRRYKLHEQHPARLTGWGAIRWGLAWELFRICFLPSIFVFGYTWMGWGPVPFSVAVYEAVGEALSNIVIPLVALSLHPTLQIAAFALLFRDPAYKPLPTPEQIP